MNKDWSALIDHAQKCNAVNVVDQPEVSVKCILRSTVCTPPLKYILSHTTANYSTSTHSVKISTTSESFPPSKHDQPSITSSTANRVIETTKNQQSKQQSSSVSSISSSRSVNTILTETGSSGIASGKNSQIGNTVGAMQRQIRRSSLSSNILCGMETTQRATVCRDEAQVTQNLKRPILDIPTDPRIQTNIVSGNRTESSGKNNDIRGTQPEPATFPRNDSRLHSTIQFGQSARVARAPTIGQNVGDTREKLERFKANDTHNKPHHSSVPKRGRSNIREQLVKSIKHT